MRNELQEKKNEIRKRHLDGMHSFAPIDGNSIKINDIELTGEDAFEILSSLCTDMEEEIQVRSYVLGDYNNLLRQNILDENLEKKSIKLLGFLLRDESSIVRDSATGVLRDISHIVLKYIESFMIESKSNKSLIQLLEILKAIGSQAKKFTPQLMKLIQSTKSNRIKMEIIATFRMIGSTKPVNLLLDLYKIENDNQIRFEIVETLGRLNPNQIRYELISILKKEKDEEIRALAAEILLRAREDKNKAVKALTKSLKDSSDLVKKAASITLGKMGSIAEDSIEELVILSESSNNWKVCSAAKNAVFLIAEDIGKKDVNDFYDIVKSKILRIDSVEKPNQTQKSVKSNLVFVIIAFQDDMKFIFEGIQAVAKKYSLDAKRVSDVPGDYKITDKIIEMIHSAKFIVADLTHERPNVYFELGYARGVGKKVYTIAKKGTKIHFDVKDWKCIFYDDSRELETKLDKEFKTVSS